MNNHIGNIGGHGTENNTGMPGRFSNNLIGGNMGAPQYITSPYTQMLGPNHTANFGNPMMNMPCAGTTYTTMPVPQTFGTHNTTTCNC